MASLVFFNYAVVVRTVGALWAALDPRTAQAAAVLGASPARVWWTVTLPALAPAIAGRLLDRMRVPQQSLSAREVEVLTWVAAGASNSRIARELRITDATVKSHLVHIFTKLGVTSRTAAVAAGRSAGIVR